MFIGAVLRHRGDIKAQKERISIKTSKRKCQSRVCERERDSDESLLARLQCGSAARYFLLWFSFDFLLSADRVDKISNALNPSAGIHGLSRSTKISATNDFSILHTCVARTEHFAHSRASIGFVWRGERIPSPQPSATGEAVN